MPHRAGFACIRVARRGKDRRGVASLDQRAVGMMITWSLIARTTPSSCEMNSIAIPVLSPELAEQLQDARLHGGVERRRDLVADQQVGLGGQRAGNRDPLLLAAAELGRPRSPRAPAPVRLA